MHVYRSASCSNPGCVLASDSPASNFITACRWPATSGRRWPRVREEMDALQSRTPLLQARSACSRIGGFFSL